MITKLVSSQNVIAKVIADLDLQEKDVKISDIEEWIGEAMEKIGAIQQFEPKVKEIEIRNHQVPLPCDLHQLHQVAYSFSCGGPWFPTRKATGSFAVWDDCHHCCHHHHNHIHYHTENDCCEECNEHMGVDHCHCHDCPDCEHGCCKDKCCYDCHNPEMFIHDDVMVNLVVDMFGNIDKTQAIEEINSNYNLRVILANLINHHTHDYGHGHHCCFDTANPSLGIQYTVKPGFIMCNAPCGFLKLSYSGIYTDEESYPMIPDMASYKEAIYWYVTMKLKYPEYLNGRMNREIYYDIRRSWNFYRQQAYAEAMMPNEDGLESIKNNWNKIVPEYNDHNTFYSHTGGKQMIYNANRV